MKKLLKAVALATVMCLLLSTAAFAAEFGTATGDKASKYITADVIGAGAGNEVVLLIVKAGVAPANADDADIMFIDQKVAGTDGAAKFENILIKDAEALVDVYVGSKATVGAKLIGEGIDLKDVKSIVIADVEKPIITAIGNGKNARGFAAAITVNIPEELNVSKMIWGFKLSTDGEGVRRYSTVQDVVGAEGDVQYAATFDMGYIDDTYDVTDVSAIFFTGDSESAEDKADPANTHYTHADLDKPNKAK